MNKNDSNDYLEIHVGSNVHISEGDYKIPNEIPSSFVNIVNEASKKIQESLPVEQSSSSTSLLSWSALQLDSARFGNDLYLHLTSEPEVIHNMMASHQTIELATANLVCRCSCTSLELCAASMYWLVENEPRSRKREADVAYWDSQKIKKHKLPPQLESWVVSLRGSHMWQIIKSFRNLFTHKYVLRDLSIKVGGKAGPGPTKVRLYDKSYDLADLLPSIIEFSENQLELYCDAIISTDFDSLN